MKIVKPYRLLRTTERHVATHLAPHWLLSIFRQHIAHTSVVRSNYFSCDTDVANQFLYQYARHNLCQTHGALIKQTMFTLPSIGQTKVISSTQSVYSRRHQSNPIQSNVMTGAGRSSLPASQTTIYYIRTGRPPVPVKSHS